MKAFVSYASSDRALAERVCRVLETEGHDVFFDRDDLGGGDAFGERIRSAIERSHVLVYLISKASVTPPSYALTELTIVTGMASRRRPAILPVRVDATPIADVPAALRAFTILEPQGDVPAEIAAAVDRIAARRRARLMVWAGAAAVLILALAGAAAFALLPQLRTKGSTAPPPVATAVPPAGGPATTAANGTGANTSGANTAGANAAGATSTSPVGVAAARGAVPPSADPFAPGGPLTMPTPETLETWNEAMLQRLPENRRVSLIGMPGAEGWSATVILADQMATKLEYRLDGEKQFTDTGENETAFNVSGHPSPNTYIQLPGEFWQRRQVTVKYTDVKGRQHGPYELAFDPRVEFTRFSRQSLSVVPWLSFQSNSLKELLAYFTTLVTFKAAFKEIRYSIDSDALDKVFPLKHVASEGWPGRITDDETYVKLPLKASFVNVQITYIDGTTQTKKVMVRRGG